jgi:hypothetical protein
MALTIDIATPVLGFGAFGLASCTVQILDGATPVTTRVYRFSLTNFSSDCDTVNADIASIHFGSHVLNISNGDYSSFNMDGVPKASIYALVNDFSDAVANLS